MILYLGQVVLPTAFFVTSTIAQKLGLLKVAHLSAANEMIGELKRLEPVIGYHRPIDVSSICICGFSDSSHGGAEETYGQSGIILGLKILSSNGKNVFYHTLRWASQKQKRVSYSSFGSEILAASNA